MIYPRVSVSGFCWAPIRIWFEHRDAASVFSCAQWVKKPKWNLSQSKSCQDPTSINSCWWILKALICQVFIGHNEVNEYGQEWDWDKELQTEFPIESQRNVHHESDVIEESLQAIYPAKNKSVINIFFILGIVLYLTDITSMIAITKIINQTVF